MYGVEFADFFSLCRRIPYRACAVLLQTSVRGHLWRRRRHDARALLQGQRIQQPGWTRDTPRFATVFFKKINILLVLGVGRRGRRSLRQGDSGGT